MPDQAPEYPKSPAPPTTVTDAEVLAVFKKFLDERAAGGVILAKAVSDVSYADGVVRVTFDAAKAGLSQEAFDRVNPFPNLSKFVATPIAFNDDIGNRIRPAVVSIETVRAGGLPLGTYSHEEILSLNGLSQ